MRQSRKVEHVRWALAEGEAAGTGFADVCLVNNSLPEIGWGQVRLQSSLAGVQLSTPLVINAMTGGASAVAHINAGLAEVAAQFGLAMAVGSQRAALQDPAVADTFRLVRRLHPKGPRLANLGAPATPDEVARAVEMVEADLVQLHVNPTQELLMAEGERNFSGWLSAIARVVQASPVPVVVKEVGFGLSREVVRRLAEVGVRAVDVGGWGGTNFARIEARRRQAELDPGLEAWGIPTAAALAEVAALGVVGLDLVASGGIRWGSEAAKALALGARAVAVAGPLLKALHQGGVPGTAAWVSGFLGNLRTCLVLAGAGDVDALGRCPVVVTGRTGQWASLRGVDLAALASRPGPA